MLGHESGWGAGDRSIPCASRARTPDGVGVGWEPGCGCFHPSGREPGGKCKARAGTCPVREKPRPRLLHLPVGSSWEEVFCHRRGVGSETPARPGSHFCCQGGNAEEELEVCGAPGSVCLGPVLLTHGLLFTSPVRGHGAVTSPPSWFLPSLTKLCETRLIFLTRYL